MTYTVWHPFLGRRKVIEAPSPPLAVLHWLAELGIDASARLESLPDWSTSTNAIVQDDQGAQSYYHFTLET